MTDPAPNTDETPEPDIQSGPGISVLFWLCLVLAAVIYGAVALSPKLLAWRSLQVEHYNNQVALVTLEWQVKYLKRVVLAFEHDPSFAAEQARIDFDATRPGDERIAVDPSLTLDSRSTAPTFPKADAMLPWYAPALALLSQDRSLRRGLLITAAVVTIVSFGLLQDAQLPGLKTIFRVVGRAADRATRRYRHR